MSAVRYKNIRWLDIAVNDSFRMRRVQGIRDFNSQFDDLVERKRPAGNPLAQRLPLEKFHRDEFAAVLFADVVNRANVRMVERGGRLRFAAEPLERGGFAGHFTGEEFQAYGAMQPRVLGLVDDAHASAAKLFGDAVMRNGLPEERLRICHCVLILGGVRNQVNEHKLR